MAEIIADGVSLAAQNGTRLTDANFEWRSPNLIALCSNDSELLVTITAAVSGQLPLGEGQLTVDGREPSSFGRHGDQVIAWVTDRSMKPRLRVDKLISRLLKRESRAVSEQQAQAILTELGIPTTVRCRDLDEQQHLLLELALPVLAKRRFIMCDQRFDKLESANVTRAWSLLRDYSRKTNSLVMMASDDVTTMLKWADAIYYFDRGHLTSTRQLPTHDSSDCVVTVTGTGFPAETAEKLGAQMLEEAPNETRILFSGNIQALLPLLEQNTITDVRITDASIKDELMAY